jgi:glycosyltransferase involved in cell wall biosynthesis
MKKYITIVIPAFNEEESIVETIQDYINFFPSSFVVVVDNNSNDRTFELANNFLKSKKIDGLVLKELRQGKAAAVQAALNRFLSTWVIMTDGDATYPASDMFALFKIMEYERYDHGVLDRISSGNYVASNNLKTFVHGFGNKMFTKLISFFSGIKYQDVLSGGRIFSYPLIETFVINCSGFELESELNFHSAEISARTYEHKCSYRSRAEDNPSKLSTIRDGLKIFQIILKLGIKRKPDILYNIFGFLLLLFGILISTELILIYIRESRVIYSSTAVAASLMLLGGIHFILYALNIRENRQVENKKLRISFNSLKRKWNEDLDIKIG